MERLKEVTEDRHRGEGTRTAFGISGMILLVLVASVAIFLVLWLFVL